MKKECDKCKKDFRILKRIKNKFYCHHCFISESNIIYVGICLSARKTVEQAVSKVRIVRGYCHNSSPYGIVHVPSCLIGKEIRVILHKDNKEEK